MKTIAFGCVLGLLLILGVRLNEAMGANTCRYYKGAAFLALLDERFPLSTAATFLKRLQCPAIGVLYKTFGKKLSRIEELQRQVGKPLKVHLYADCGPCRYPRRPRGYAPLFKPELSIDEFNDQIVALRRLRIAYRREMLRPLYRLSAKNRSLIVEALPALEDNYTFESRRVILRAMRAEKRLQKAPVKIKINPLFFIPYSGYPIEAHSCSSRAPDALRPGDSLSFDGIHISFPGERGSCTHTRAKEIIKKSVRKQIDILLWRAPWQGLENREGVVGKPIPDRIYTLDKLSECLTILKG